MTNLPLCKIGNLYAPHAKFVRIFCCNIWHEKNLYYAKCLWHATCNAKQCACCKNMSFKAVMAQNAVYLAINKIMKNAVCLKLAQLVQNKFFKLKNII